MGVLGAFPFPGPRDQFHHYRQPVSSGHLGGGILLAILPVPMRLLTIASVLVVQALFFADGGLLALGCNISTWVSSRPLYRILLIYVKLTGANPSRRRMGWRYLFRPSRACNGTFLRGLETYLSGISELPFSAFLFRYHHDVPGNRHCRGF